MPDALPHGDLIEVFPDIFWLQGTVRMGPGIIINRVMVVLRHEGALTVINAIRPGDPAVLDALGTVRNVIQIGVHHMDDAWYRQHYGATQWAPAGIAGAEVVLGPDSAQPVPWIQTFRFAQTQTPELALLADRDRGVLITCDSVQNWPDSARCSLLARGMLPVMGFTARPAQIGGPWRKRQTPAGGSLRGDFERLLALPFDHLIGGHGAPLIGGAHAALQATVQATF